MDDLGHFVLRDLVHKAGDEAKDLEPIRLQAVPASRRRWLTLGLDAVEMKEQSRTRERDPCR